MTFRECQKEKLDDGFMGVYYTVFLLGIFQYKTQSKTRQSKNSLWKVFSHVYSDLRPLSFDATNIISLSAINKVRHSFRLNQMKLPIFHIGLGSVLTYNKFTVLFNSD